MLEGPGTLKSSETLAPGAQAQEEAYSLALGKQGPWQSDVVRLVYSSMVTPESTYDIDVRTGGAEQSLRACLGPMPWPVYALHALAGPLLVRAQAEVGIQTSQVRWCHRLPWIKSMRCCWL